ncbi:MAG: D-alanyl-D-alanine carboxypeptidase family protein [Lachnospiraceae bacterium]
MMRKNYHTNLRGTLRYLTAAVLILCMVCLTACSSSAAGRKDFTTSAASASASAQTREAAVSRAQIFGLVTYKNLSAQSSSYTDTIQVRPAYGRKLMLQKYSRGSKQWVTTKTYTLDNVRTAKVKLQFRKSSWANSSYSDWRVVLAASKDDGKYISETIRLTTRNRETLSITSKAAVVINAKTGVVLYAKNMNEKRAQASTTKVMTAIVAMENMDLDDRITISSKAAAEPYSYYTWHTGDEIHMKNLLYAALMRSSNGAATALAEGTAGSVSRFAEKMNAKAQKIGAENTKYVNAHGLDVNGHYSTAYDTALITAYAYLNFPKFRTIIGTSSYSFRSIRGRYTYNITTTNELLGKIDGFKGGKTGTTSNAGNCFTGVYTKGGKTFIVVTLGSSTHSSRWTDTRALISYADKYGW